MADEQKPITPEEAVEIHAAAKMLARDVLLQCFNQIKDEPGQVALACALAEDSIAFVKSRVGREKAHETFKRLLDALSVEDGAAHKSSA